MPKAITPNQIKQNNRELIYRLIYKEKKISQQDISYALRLSRPTVTANLAELEMEGLIRKDGQIESDQVGRKAAAYTVNPLYRIAIGTEFTRKELKIAAVDLYGEQITRMDIPMEYENSDAYYREVSSKILAFADTLPVSRGQILGVGIAVPGLVSPDTRTIIYGKILDCTGLTIDVFEQYLPWPCAFIHDANSAAISELWVSPGLQDALYLSLSTHLGAALISDGEVKYGIHGHTATLEHIRIRPRGEVCYCGKRGCAETVCSMQALLKDGEDPERFFAQARAGEPDSSKRWQNFLTSLAEVINLSHMLCDTTYILGGNLALYLCEEDIRYLHSRIAAMSSFEEPQDFIRISKMPKHSISIGAGLYYVRQFAGGDRRE